MSGNPFILSLSLYCKFLTILLQNLMLRQAVYVIQKESFLCFSANDGVPPLASHFWVEAHFFILFRRFCSVVRNIALGAGWMPDIRQGMKMNKYKKCSKRRTLQPKTLQRKSPKCQLFIHAQR